MKAFTDIEQSKKLAEILPLKSADMYIDTTITPSFTGFIREDAPRPITINDLISNNGIYPCWSLAALLEVLPLGIYDELDYCDYELEINMIDKMPRYIRLGDISHSQFPWDFEKDTLIDNIVESIIWLNDNNYFEL